MTNRESFMSSNIVRNKIFQNKIENFKLNKTDEELRKDLNLLQACIDVALIFLGDVQTIENVCGLPVLNTKDNSVLLIIFVNGEMYQTVGCPGCYKDISYDSVLNYFIWKNRDSELYPQVFRIDIYTDSKATNNMIVVDGHLYSFEVNKEAICLA